jgi:hypothetical protein
MATHYTCDRCGKPAPKFMPKHAVTTPLVHWNNNQAKSLVVTAKITGTYDECDGDAPDLCNACRADILRAAADLILQIEADAEALTEQAEERVS